MAESLKVGQLYAEITTKGLPTVTRGLDKLKAKIFSLKTAFVGLSAGLGLTKLAKEIINTGAEFETYRKRLLAVTKDQKVANEVFAEMSKWAAQNPVDTDDAIAAFVRLKSAAVENTKEATVAVGNLAALMGRSMADTADALVAVNARTLRTYGIQLSTAGDKATIQIGKTVTVVKNSLQEIRQGIVSTVQKEYSNVMDLMKDTWEGNLKTMGGMWTELMRDLAGDSKSGGPFDAVKKAMIDLRKKWEEWVKSSDYKTFVQNFRTSATSAFNSVKGTVSGLLGVLKKVLTHIDKIISALKGLVAFKLTKSALLLLGVSNPAALAAAGGAALIAYASDQSPATPKQDAERALRDKIKNIKALIEQNKRDIDANGGLFGSASLAEQLKKENVGLDAQLREYYRQLDRLQAPLHPLGKKESEVQGGEGSTGKGASAEQRLNAVKAIIQRMRDEITYAGASAADFLPVLDQMLGRYPRLSEEWKAVKDLQLEGLEEIKTKAQESVQRIVEAEDWRYSVGITSAEQYFATLKARYIDAMMSLEGVAEGSLRDKLTGQMREAYEGLQNVAVAALDQVREKMDAGAMSTEQAHAFALKLIDALNALGIEPPEALKKFADGTDEAKERMKDLEAQSKKWIEDFQSGIADAIVDGKNFGDVLTDIGKQIEKMILKMLLFGANGDSGVFGGLFKSIGNLFSVKAPAHHTGGVVGVDPPSFFRSLLPKYHSGGIVGAGEELAILRKREAVFTPEQMKALGAAVNRPRMGDIKIVVNAYNDGYGNMSDEQAQGIGEMVKGIVKAQVAEEFYTYSRSGYFRTAGAM